MKINASVKVYYADNMTLKQYLSHFFYSIQFKIRVRLKVLHPLKTAVRIIDFYVLRNRLEDNRF